MLAEEDRAEVRRLLRGMRHPAVDLAGTLDALEQAASSFRRRSALRGASARIGDVISQLSALVDTAHLAARTGSGSIPPEILPETFEALVGRYPYSNVDVAPVIAEMLQRSGGSRASPRTAVIDATVAPHVVNAALRRFPGEPHLVACRSTPFPFEAANAYFFEGLTESAVDDLRRRLGEFIVQMTDVAPEFLEHVRDRVCLSTRDPNRQNPGRRTLYDWAEPSPGARLVWDVLETVLQPMTERPKRPVQDVIIRIIDLLVGSMAAGDIRPDVISAMLTIWVASCQHHIVATRLSAMLDGMPGRAETPRCRRRRGFWISCLNVVLDSAAELWRRGCMGDHHNVAQLGGDPEPACTISTKSIGGATASSKGRATGSPVPTLDLAAAATAGTDMQFLRILAKACGPYLRPHAGLGISRR